MRPFPCTKCGMCCQIQGVIRQLGPASGVSKEMAELAAGLDRGDGTCRNYDEESRLCRIYEERPFLCRVQEQAEKSGTPRAVYLTFLRGCQSLQKHDPSLPDELRVTDEMIEPFLKPEEK